jgi:hypothetical protein
VIWKIFRAIPRHEAGDFRIRTVEEAEHFKAAGQDHRQRTDCGDRSQQMAG